LPEGGLFTRRASLRRKRQQAHVIAAPAGVLDRRTLSAACTAAGALP